MILGEDQPLSIGQVSKMVVINLFTMMRIIERIEKAGLVVSRTSAHDACMTELPLTEFGFEKLIAVRGVAAPVYQRLIKGGAVLDFSRLRDLLSRAARKSGIAPWTGLVARDADHQP